MNLQDLKHKSPAELLDFAESLQIENASTLRRQDGESVPVETIMQPVVYASVTCSGDVAARIMRANAIRSAAKSSAAQVSLEKREYHSILLRHIEA